MQLKRLTTTRLTTTLYQGVLRINPPPTTPKNSPKSIAQVETVIRRERRDKQKQGSPIDKKILDIAVTHPQGEDVWDGLRPPTIRQTPQSKFENSRNYSNALTNLSEKKRYS